MERKVRGGDPGKYIFFIKIEKLGNKAVLEVYMTMGVCCQSTCFYSKVH
jgi:hypothetical protein